MVVGILVILRMCQRFEKCQEEKGGVRSEGRVRIDHAGRWDSR